MKKFLLAILLVLIINIPATATTLKGSVIGEISTYYPRDFITIKVLKNTTIKGIELKKGYIVEGTMTDVVSPEKCGKEASFVFTITNYKDFEGINHEINTEIKTKYTNKSLFNCKFLDETDISFGPNIPIPTETGLSGSTNTQAYKNVNVKPLSLMNSFAPKEYQLDDDELDIRQHTGLSSEKDDILLLDGDKIKFNFD